jgi:prophage DNA circulation protein
VPIVDAPLAGLLGLESGKTWRDRIKEAAYKSPTGTRIRFEYEDLERVHTKRGTAFEFPGVDGAYIQQRGLGARRYPMRCIFSGPDCDRIATAFEKACSEPGMGVLEHPVHGTIPNIVPFGDFTRNDPLKTAANQAIVEVTFWRSLPSLYPAATADAKSEIDTALEGFDVEAAQEFSESTSLLSAASRANMKGTVRSFLRDVSATLSNASDAVASVKREFDDQVRLINFGMDVLVGQPLLLAQQVSNLIKAPGRALAGIQSRLAGYAALADRIFSSRAGSTRAPAVSAVGLGLGQRNDFQAAQLFATNAVAGTVVANSNHRFRTKPEALEAAAEMAELHDEVTRWRDDGFVALGVQDPGAAAQKLLQAVALTAGHLVETSFTLLQERRIVLDRERTIIDLAAELYGSVDDRLDLLINSNDLTGSEILELPRGRTIVYYPEG